MGLFWLFALIAAAGSNAATAQQSGSQPSGGFLPLGLSALFGGSAETPPSARRTRIIIDLKHQSRFDISSLSRPNRVIVELPQTGMRLPRLGTSDNNGLVRDLRGGQSAPGRSRIVIDVSEPVVVESAQMVPNATGRGAQLEILLAPFDEKNRALRAALRQPESALGSPLGQPPVPKRAGGADGGRQAAGYRPLIVIDPGHGGKDSGARKFGVNEKDVVLAFGTTLRDRLEKTGRYRVKMTRSTDVFITLDNRREFAERNDAALFIAVHADYAGVKARGATIYSLRTRVANRLREAAAEDAAREAMSDSVMQNVKADSDDLNAVRGILGDLAQREVHVNLERTNVFTKFAIDQMGEATTMRSKPHREAAFAVLKTARVPSVLIELAYVSNRRDAARLQSQAWRDEVSGSLVTAIDNYFAHSLSQIAQ